MKKFLLTLFTGFFSANLIAQQVLGPQGGTSFGNAYLDGASQNWVNTQNVASSDNQFASFGNLNESAGSHTDYLVVAGFGFNIPAGSQITGIVAYVESSDPNASTGDYNIRIMKDGVIGTSEHSAGALYPNGEVKGAVATYGSSSDLWGETWTPAMINASNFGIAVSAQRIEKGRETQGRIDNIRLAVYYTALTTLPVKLTSFTAAIKQGVVRLTWTTAEEENMDRYEVQRSANGVDYTSFGTLICQNHAALTPYAFNDYSPIQGTSSYRLKMREKDGSITYSKVIPIQFQPETATTLYPSPWKKGETLYIHNPGNEKLNIQFIDASGDIVSKVTTTSNQVPATTLAPAKGILRYKVFNMHDEVSGSGAMFIY